MAKINLSKVSATSALKFHESDAESNGLFIGELESVTVDMVNASENNPAFSGLKMPRLTYKFGSKHQGASKKHAYIVHLPVPGSPTTLPSAGKGGDYWKVNAITQYAKHILEIFYLKGRELTPEEDNFSGLDLPYMNEDGSYNDIPQDLVIDAYTEFFTHIAAMLNGEYNLKEGETPKPCFKDNNGTPVKIWMKLIRASKNSTKGWVNNGDGSLGFPTFVGEGVFEAYKQGVLPSIIRLDTSKETIKPLPEVKKTPTIGAGIPTTLGGADMAAAAALAGAESPWGI